MAIIRYFFLFWIIILSAAPQCLGSDYTGNSLVVVTIPGLELEDISSLPALHHLGQTGGMALMNTSSLNKKSVPAAYLTLGAGSKALCPRPGDVGLEADEEYNGLKASLLYESYQGKAGESRILLPYLQTLIRANEESLKPGLLGDILENKGIPVFLIGNQDLPASLSRPGVLIAMNSRGQVPRGHIDNTILYYDSALPTSRYNLFLEKTTAFLGDTGGVAFVDLGDLFRLDAQNAYYSEKEYQNQRQLLLSELDTFLGQLASYCQEQKTSLLIITPFPGQRSTDLGNTLAPVILKTPLTSPPALLTSASTKRAGIITNLDIAPTILSLLDIEQSPAMIGHPLRQIPQQNPPLYLDSLLAQITANYLQRPYLIKGYVIMQIIVVLSTILLILLQHPLLQYTGPLILALTTVPLLFLYLSFFPPLDMLSRLFLLLTATLFCVLFLKRIGSPIRQMAVLYLLTSFSIAADLFWQAPLMKNSLLGYDPISGARYYGLGNEYMGVLLGSSLIGFSLLLETAGPDAAWRGRLQALAALIFPALFFLVAAPQGGTNVGGAISFFFSSIFLVFLLYRQRISMKLLAGTGVGIILALTLLFGLDLHRPVEAQSHIGLTARIVKENGPAALVPIMARKISMNIKLFHYSIWTRVLLTFLGATAVMAYRPSGLMAALLKKHPCLKIGLIASLSGSGIALAVNDSGIVAAATAMIYIVPTLLYLIASSNSLKQGDN